MIKMCAVDQERVITSENESWFAKILQKCAVELENSYGGLRSDPKRLKTQDTGTKHKNRRENAKISTEI